MPSFPDPEQLESKLLHELAAFQDSQVLEIGIGDGRMARHYAGGTRVTVGMDSDLDELILSRADHLKQLRTKAQLVQGRAEALPFAESSFNLVVLGWSL